MRLAQSLLPQGEQEAGIVFQAPTSSGEDAEGLHEHEADPLPELTASAIGLAHLQGVCTPSTPVQTNMERQQFDSMCLSFLQQGRQSWLDLDRFALEWNAGVDAQEKGGQGPNGVFRKTVAHLKAHWTE